MIFQEFEKSLVFIELCILSVNVVSFIIHLYTCPLIHGVIILSILFIMLPKSQ